MKSRSIMKRIITIPVLVLLLVNVRTIRGEILLRGTKEAQTLQGSDGGGGGGGRKAVDCGYIDENGEDVEDIDMQGEGEDISFSREKKKILCKTANLMLDTMKDRQPNTDEEEIAGRDIDTDVEAMASDRARSSKEVAHVSNEDIINNLHFYIRTKAGKRGNRPSCGGCEMLWDLYDEIVKRGASADTQEDLMPGNDYKCPTDEMLAEPLGQGKTIVFVYPETSRGACNGNGNRVHVRWILAPLGALVEQDRWKSWGSDDLVFSYSSIVAGKPDVPVSNILQILSSPEPGDNTDVPIKEFFNKKGRSGIIWMLRKAAPYKDILTYVHKNHGLSYWQNERPKIPDDFLKYEYFVSYDPYTYYTFAAAMVGTVSVIAPIDGFTKHQWLRGTYVGEYMEATGKPVPGIAYGWDERELEYARKTMFALRNYMFKVRAWGRDKTVPRFMRDCYRYSRGAQNSTQLEGGMLVSESFSDDTKGPLQQFFDTHAHTGLGHHNVVEDNDVTDDGYTELSYSLEDEKDDGYGFSG